MAYMCSPQPARPNPRRETWHAAVKLDFQGSGPSHGSGDTGSDNPAYLHACLRRTSSPAALTCKDNVPKRAGAYFPHQRPSRHVALLPNQTGAPGMDQGSPCPLPQAVARTSLMHRVGNSGSDRFTIGPLRRQLCCLHTARTASAWRPRGLGA